MAFIKKKKSFDQTQRVEGDTIKLDMKDPGQAAVYGKYIRDIQNGDFDDMQNLQSIAGMFIKDNKHKPNTTVVERVTVYEVTPKAKGGRPIEVFDEGIFNTLMATGDYDLTGSCIREIKD